ncbi:lysozyme inhibitor LprI family protein [Pseudomonas sp. UYIF39]|uniref:lysozyme inhibitor LprI family protein n=1 Tax=Pseudomonas sp. UYIF39 TaxID=1630747 RepID=UPI00249ECE5A|nr:lysozyme inhibitor LprI family protein [Pseudomonas sp. UYIF39]MDI3353537.1 lysozyme inhibitor LprI family protein [Pseudomonas sp. UYIF39]
MKRFFLGALCALTCQAVLPVSVALARDECTENTTSQQVDKCSEVSKVAADSQLNTSYHQLMARLETQYQAEPDTGTAYTAKVKEAQRAWIKLRDANCPLEAFEIKSGTSAYVTTVNNCVARMSRERSVFLDNTAPDIVSGSAVGRGSDVSCPSQDFAQFLPVFSANAESQRRLTALAVKMLVLKRTEDPGRFEPSITGETGSSLAFPLMAAVGKGKTEGVEIEQVDDSHVNVVDKRAGNSNIKIFNFSRKACWALVGVEDWSISEKELVASSKPGMSRAESFCYQRAEGLGGLGAMEQYRLTKELFEASLENYVCAAESGDPQASLSAASLSLSQMAPQLETSKLEALFKAASTTASGALGYATYFCNGNSTDYNGPCLHPEEAEREVIRAVSMGSTDAMSYLGSSFESGQLGTKDLSRALTCYQLSADKGHPQGSDGVKRLVSQGSDIKASHCL